MRLDIEISDEEILSLIVDIQCSEITYCIFTAMVPAYLVRDEVALELDIF